jgi:hypothetical protein
VKARFQEAVQKKNLACEVLAVPEITITKVTSSDIDDSLPTIPGVKCESDK